MRILLVEDEESLADALACILKKNHFLVDVTYDGIEGEDMALTGIYDLIILDRMLPGKEGLDIIKSIRHCRLNTPVIFLTAKDAVTARIEGLDAGADDYLIKPFSADELLARIRALVRRPSAFIENTNLQIGYLILDVTHSLAKCDTNVIKLTYKECQLLELLMRHPNQVLTKEQILERIWGYDSDIELNSVELYIYYLRKKLHAFSTGCVIETVRGIGYTLKEVDHV